MCRTPERVLKAIEIKAQNCRDGMQERRPRVPVSPQWVRYWEQWPEEGDWPDVWIVAADMLFFSHEVFKNAKAVIPDESFWQKGLRGTDDKKPVVMIPLEVLRMTEQEENEPLDPADPVKTENWWLRRSRHRLAQLLSDQINDGYVEAHYLFDDACSTRGDRTGMERGADQKPRCWDCIPACRKSCLRIWRRTKSSWSRTSSWPADDHDLARDRTGDAVCRTDEAAVFGRLRLDKIKGVRVLSWRGVEEIHKPYADLPTLMLDAVLPGQKILEVFLLQRRDRGAHRCRYRSGVCRDQTDYRCADQQEKAERREASRGSETLHPLRMDGERQMRDVGCLSEGLSRVATASDFSKLEPPRTDFPESIHVEHYNDLAGRDEFKDVELQIMVGARGRACGRWRPWSRRSPGEVPVRVAADMMRRRSYERNG